MKFKYYVLTKFYNDHATATLFTAQEAQESGYNDGYHVEGDTFKNHPDVYLDGYSSLAEAQSVVDDIKAGNF